VKQGVPDVPHPTPNKARHLARQHDPFPTRFSFLLASNVMMGSSLRSSSNLTLSPSLPSSSRINASRTVACPN
jgi:hypothetical protein